MWAIARRPGGCLAILVCALAAHAAAYRSFWPGDGVHGYFGWYEPLVGVLSGCAAAVVALSLALGLRQPAVLGWLRPWRSPSRLAAARLGALSLGVLITQESVERSFGVHHPAVASFPASTWLVVVASVSVAAAVLTFLARWCGELVEIILGRRTPLPSPPPDERSGAAPAPPRPRNPLANRLGMRAPPRVLPDLTGRNEGRTFVRRHQRRARVAIALAVVLGSLWIAAAASAHAIVSPAVAKANVLQQFTLSVPTEKEGLTTTKIEMTVPSSFAIDSFAPPPVGWTQQVHATGSGEEAVVQSVTWTGGHVPTGQDAVFQFNASVPKSGTVTFDVRQTYSDGSVVDWNGPESSDNPAPTLQAVSSFSSGGSSTLGIVAIVLAAAALLIAGAGLFRGKRSLA